MPKGQYTKTRRQVLALAEKRAKKRDVAESGQRKMRTRQRIEQAAVPGREARQVVRDVGLQKPDNTPPGAPTVVVVSPGDHALIVRWAEPPAADGVARTLVRLTRVDNGLSSVRTATGLLHGVTGLDLVAHDVEAAHRDRFGNQSAWSAAVRVTPLPSVADQITAATKVAAGELSQLLNDPGLAPLTQPDKLAEAVVRSAALAGTQDPNLLRYDEAEFENHPAGALAGAVNGAGVTTSVVSAPAPKRWLSVSRSSTATGNTARPFGSYRDRLEGQAVGTFFFAFEARNTGASAVRVQAVCEQSSDGTATTTQASGEIVGVGPGEARTVFVKFSTDATLAFQRFGVVLPDAATSVLVNRQMLQRTAPAKTEPGPYRVPGLTAGVVSAQLLAAWTVAAGRAILADATIDQALIANAAIGNLQIDRASANKLQVLSADVVSLVAEKLVGGLITAQTFILGAGGLFRTSNNGLRLDDGGITLQPGPSYDSPSITRDSKISNPADTVSYAVYSDATKGFRGAVIRADGTGGGTGGAVTIHATADGLLNSLSGRVEVLGRSNIGIGQVNLYEDVQVSRDLNVLRDLFAQRDAYLRGRVSILLFDPSRETSGTVAPGTTTTVTWTVALPRAPRIVTVFINGEPLPTPDNLVFVSAANTTTFSIRNNRAAGTASVNFVAYVQA